jgi:glycosyltransferase involved in cell wall biosynthesis
VISVICPFYNEEDIIEASVKLMLHNLASLGDQWELIIVNDGSTDGSLGIARELEKEHGSLRVISYERNRGRGYAMRTGIAEARGEIVVTTEIDSSWGDDIVHRIVEEFEKRPDADMIIASPHLPGGGYKNVPAHRVLLSTFGNYVLRAGLTYTVTMNTGMTRGYRREKFLALPLDEDEKEIHLEIVNKALSFGYRMYEIPAVLEWKDKKLSKKPGKKRKSSSNVQKLVRTHLLFSLGVAPFRYLYPVATLLLIASAVFIVWGVINLFLPGPSIYLILTGMSLALFGFLVFGIGVLAQQNRALTRELWKLGTRLKDIQDTMRDR